MWTIGITGSIASGKSTLLDAFAQQGVPVFSADAAVADLYGGEAVAAVETLFPDVSVEGRVDRQRLAAHLAANPEDFARLEAVIHPLVRSRIARFIEQARNIGEKLVAVEVPLLFESGYDYGFDAIAVTFVDQDIQNQRIMARPGMTVEKRDALLARQMPQDEKKKRATYLFDMARPLGEIRDMVAALVAGIRAQKDTT